jgi:hypothetical protein
MEMLSLTLTVRTVSNGDVIANGDSPTVLLLIDLWARNPFVFFFSLCVHRLKTAGS